MNFTDKNNRKIILQINDDEHLEALHDGQVIGTFEFRSEDENPADRELMHMDINNDYRRAGIGTELMRFAVKQYEYFLLPKPITFPNASNYLTDEGANLVNYCFRMDILPAAFEKQYESEQPYDEDQA